MITVTIGKEKYQIPDRWKELSLETYIDLVKVPMPEKLKDFIGAQIQYASAPRKNRKKYDQVMEQLTPDDYNIEFPKYYGELIQAINKTISPEEVDRLNHLQREAIFETALKYLAYTMATGLPLDFIGGQITEYEPDPVSVFYIDGENYHFPKSLRFTGMEVAMAEEKIVTFSEATAAIKAVQELAEHGAESLPTFMAVYCRKKGEEYSEKMVLERSEIFKKVTMDIVWSLFFYTFKLIPKYERDIQLFMKVQEERLLQELSSGITE